MLVSVSNMQSIISICVADIADGQVNIVKQQESIPVGCMPPAPQLCMCWRQVLGSSTRGKYPEMQVCPSIPDPWIPTPPLDTYPRDTYPRYIPPRYLPEKPLPLDTYAEGTYSSLWYLDTRYLPLPRQIPAPSGLWDTYSPLKYLPPPRYLHPSRYLPPGYLPHYLDTYPQYLDTYPLWDA